MLNKNYIEIYEMLNFKSVLYDGMPKEESSYICFCYSDDAEVYCFEEIFFENGMFKAENDVTILYYSDSCALDTKDIEKEFEYEYFKIHEKQLLENNQKLINENKMLREKLEGEKNVK